MTSEPISAPQVDLTLRGLVAGFIGARIRRAMNHSRPREPARKGRCAPPPLVDRGVGWSRDRVRASRRAGRCASRSSSHSSKAGGRFRDSVVRPRPAPRPRARRSSATRDPGIAMSSLCTTSRRDKARAPHARGLLGVERQLARRPPGGCSARETRILVRYPRGRHRCERVRRAGGPCGRACRGGRRDQRAEDGLPQRRGRRSKAELGSLPRPRRGPSTTVWGTSASWGRRPSASAPNVDASDPLRPRSDSNRGPLGASTTKQPRMGNNGGLPMAILTEDMKRVIREPLRRRHRTAT